MSRAIKEAVLDERKRCTQLAWQHYARCAGTIAGDALLELARDLLEDPGTVTSDPLLTMPRAPSVPPGAVTAAGNALRSRWLSERPNVMLPSFGLDPMEWAACALEAAWPHLTARPSVVIKVSGKMDEASLAKLRKQLKEAMHEAAS